MNYEPSQEKFLADVGKHSMTIEYDYGVFRSLKFSYKGSSSYYFRINTWPWHLCISGDMGTYVFSRLIDMFEFFRPCKSQGKDFINPCYWAEKLNATDKASGHEKFSRELFDERISQTIKDFFDGEEKEKESDLTYRLMSEVLSIDDGEIILRDALERFDDDGLDIFNDFWECDFSEYTYRYIWCCRAIVWAIQQYDLATRR